MVKSLMQKFTKSIFIAIVGVFIIDYFFHLLFSSPMETFGYFMAKMAFYVIFSFIFLLIFEFSQNEFFRVLIGGIAISSLWGMYYNVLPAVFDYYPFGIPLGGLTFLGMGIFGTGLAFGIVHTVAFIGGYYSSKAIFKKYTNK